MVVMPSCCKRPSSAGEGGMRTHSALLTSPFPRAPHLPGEGAQRVHCQEVVLKTP